MVKIIEPKIETEELKPDGSYGRFVVEPLDRGFGTTLGNSLRRVLLSSLPGVAVTSIKIDGVQHEFSTIEGVKEDVTEIVLNIKGLTAKLYCEGPKTVYINAEGECEVTAGSIQCDSDVEILDPSMHIATLGPNASLRMEIVLDKGQGYISADKNKQIAKDKNNDKSVQDKAQVDIRGVEEGNHDDTPKVIGHCKSGQEHLKTKGDTRLEYRQYAQREGNVCSHRYGQASLHNRIGRTNEKEDEHRHNHTSTSSDNGKQCLVER